MTTKKQILRIAIMVAVIGLVFFAGRELYFARNITQQSIMVKLTGADLTKQASAIILGTVQKEEGTYRFTADNNEVMVNTRWSVSVDKILKGNVPASIVVQTPGGRYNLTEIIVEDAASFTAGEKVLLYLEASPVKTGEYAVTGEFQGHFTQTKDASGNEVYEQQETKETKMLVTVTDEIKQAVQK